MSSQTATVTTVKPHSSVRIEMTEYDPSTGQATRKLSSLNFDKTTIERFSTPIVIKMNVVGVQKINNIKLAIIKSSQTITGSGTKNSDNSVPSGNFGVEHSTSLSEKPSLASFFNELSNGSPANTNNIAINNSSDTESEYVYLNAMMPGNIGRGYAGYKWFFDFV